MSTKTLASKKDLLAALKKNKVKKIPVPQLDAEVYIRKISGADRLELMELVSKSGKKDENPQSLEMSLSLGLSDADGKRIFGSEDLAEIAEIFPIDVLSMLAVEVLTFNGIGEKSHQSAKKNSKKRPNSGSSSA